MLDPFIVAELRVNVPLAQVADDDCDATTYAIGSLPFGAPKTLTSAVGRPRAYTGRMRISLVILTVGFFSLTAQAVECPTANGTKAEGVGAQSGEDRLRFLSGVFEKESVAMNRWTAVFAGGFAALSVGQLGISAAVDQETRPDYYWGALSSAVGATTVLLSAPKATREAAAFRLRAQNATPEETCSLVAEGEEMLKQGAKGEAFGTAWYAHVANVLFNAAFGAIYLFAYDHVRTAVINTAVGLVLGESMILFQPTGLVTGLEQYRTGAVRRPMIAWSIYPTGLGAAFALRF